MVGVVGSSLGVVVGVVGSSVGVVGVVGVKVETLLAVEGTI